MTMEAWRRVWRVGLAPQFSVAGLKALEHGLRTDDPRILQGATCSPPPLQCVQDWDVAAADAIGYIGWQGDGLTIVKDVEGYFARVCFEADERMNESAACRYWLNWYDDTPRAEMRRHLRPEVIRELERRSTADSLPPVVQQLRAALDAGEDCAFALHDALIDAGREDLAAAYRKESRP